jgi:hypothetical protein
MRVLKRTRLIPPAADVGSEAYTQLRTFLEIAEGSPAQNRVSDLLSELRELWEIVAVQLLLRLADRGALDSIKKCICGVWFIAERRNHQSCSDKCRHKRYEQGESAKQKRRQYMRNYYRLKISGKVK